ncbi:TonB-dependent siderophore receptor [Pseudomonas sp. MLB6B]
MPAPLHNRLHPLAKALLMRQSIRPHKALACCGMGLALNLASSAYVQAQEWTLDIPAQPLNSALQSFARQADVQILFSPADVEGLRSNPLRGRYDLQGSLGALLRGTNLRYQIDGNTITVTASAGAAAAGQVELSATTVNSMGLGETTEGTGSYTTGQTSTATKMNLSIRETPQTITVVTRQRMDDQHLMSMTDVLKSTPGITMTQDGGERYNIYSRGNAINTYQFDGVTTIQENVTRTMPTTLLDMALYDHVEIVRGATGLMTGAGEPSGVVNLIRKKPTAEFKSYVQGSVGSWDNYRAEADVSGPLNEQKTIRGRLVAAKQDNDTFMDWYTQDREIVYGVVEGDLTDSTLLRFGIDNQKYKATGSPGVPMLYDNGQPTHFSRSTSSGARWGYEKFDTTNYTSTLEQKLANDWELRVVGNYMEIKRDLDNTTYSSQTGNAFIDQATGEAEGSHDKANVEQIQKGVDVTLRGPFELFGRSHDLVVGYNYSDYHNDHTAYSSDVEFNYNTWDNQIANAPFETGLDFDIKSRKQGYFAASRFNLTDQWHLILGARVSDYSYDYYFRSYRLATPQTGNVIPDDMRETGVVTPYAGLVYDITPEQSIYASYTDIFLPQSARDINGKSLEPIVGKNYELGWKGEFFDGRLNGNVAAYWIKRDNFAEYAGTSDITKEDYYTAVDGSETKGIDLELTGEITPGWNLQTGYSHTRTEDAEGTRLTTQLPMDTFRLWTTYRLPGEWEKLTLGGGVNWNSKSSVYFRRFGSRITQDDYAVASLMARYKINDNLAATVNVENLFDEKYYSGMAGSYGHYGAPRNANLTLRYDF